MSSNRDGFGVKRALKMAEIRDILEASDDDSDEEHIRDNAFNVVYIPPLVDSLSDDEDIDDTVIAGDEISPLMEIAGEVEIEYSAVNSDIGAPLENPEHASTSDKREYPSKSSIPKPKWVHSKLAKYTRNVHDTTGLSQHQETIFQDLNGKTPIDFFNLFIDDEIINMIVSNSNEYARQHNEQETIITEQLVRRFLGFLLFSGYHTVPQYENYWSKQPDLGVPIIKESLSRAEFRFIKKYLHLADNNNLDVSDRFAKIRPLLDALNKKFMQFGIFSEHLSIDEQMVPYFGRHSSKMFIRNKPIRFGFKLWVLASSNGYMYSCMPYAGSAQPYDKELGLGAYVVLELLKNVQYPEWHYIFFDNFFTSYYLLNLLSERRFLATGTVRKNRLPKNELKNEKKTLPKGECDYMFDRANEIFLVSWHDNSVVTMATNFDSYEPVGSARRYNRKEHQYVNVQQPNIFKNYNTYMGGVDMADNAISNYRINIRSKKWWWPLFINAIDSAVVNAWKLHCFISKMGQARSMSQLEFRSEITRSLLLYESTRMDISDSDVEGNYERSSLPSLRVPEHVIMKHPDGKKRRCKGCGTHTPFICKKCNVHLHTKCFASYHNS